MWCQVGTGNIRGVLCKRYDGLTTMLYTCHQYKSVLNGNFNWKSNNLFSQHLNLERKYTGVKKYQLYCWENSWEYSLEFQASVFANVAPHNQNYPPKMKGLCALLSSPHGLPRSSRNSVQGVLKVLWGVGVWRSGNYTAQRQVKHWLVYCKYKWIFIFSFLA